MKHYNQIVFIFIWAATFTTFQQVQARFNLGRSVIRTLKTLEKWRVGERMAHQPIFGAKSPSSFKGSMPLLFEKPSLQLAGGGSFDNNLFHDGDTLSDKSFKVLNRHTPQTQNKPDHFRSELRNFLSVWDDDHFSNSPRSFSFSSTCDRDGDDTYDNFESNLNFRYSHGDSGFRNERRSHHTVGF